MTDSYETFWSAKALDYITPKDLPNPEGFNVYDTLRDLVGDDSIVEFGCGYGRLAPAFSHEKYHGVDINIEAINKAKDKYPKYSFTQIGFDGPIPVRLGTGLLYCVCLHIPDDKLFQQMERFTNSVKNSLIIAEIMDPSYRKNRKEGVTYDLSNQRDSATYQRVMSNFGFTLFNSLSLPYKHYKGSDITFLKFGRT